MKKQKLLIVVNILLFISFVITILSVAIYRFIPSPIQGDEIVGSIHGIAGIIFFFLTIAHISLNWIWVKKMIFKKGVSK